MKGGRKGNKEREGREEKWRRKGQRGAGRIRKGNDGRTGGTWEDRQERMGYYALCHMIQCNTCADNEQWNHSRNQSFHHEARLYSEWSIVGSYICSNIFAKRDHELFPENFSKSLVVACDIRRAFFWKYYLVAEFRVDKYFAYTDQNFWQK